MDTLFQYLLPQVGKCAALVAFGSAVTGLLVRNGPASGARWVRMACVMALLQGWMLFPMTVTLAWLSPTTAAQHAEAESGALRAYALNPKTAPAPGTSWTPWPLVGALWVAGIVTLVAVAAAGHRRLVLSLRRSRSAPPHLVEEWHSVAGESAGAVRILAGPALSPVLCRLHGHWSLVLPQDFDSALDEHERRTVFRHEFAHYQRRDCVKSLLVALLVLPQWFNPAAWRLARWFREAAEWSCDDHAAASPDERLRLARVLQRLSVQSRTPLPFGMMGVAEHPVVDRVRRLLTPRAGLSRRLLSAVTALLMLCVAASATQVRLVPAAGPSAASAGHGATAGMVRGCHDGRLTIEDGQGHLWEFAFSHPCLQTYLPGETCTVYWNQDPGGLLLQRISGEGSFAGTVTGIHESGLDIQPQDGGPVQHIRAHWDSATPARPHGGSNRDDMRVIRSTKLGDLVQVRWQADEWKRLVELTRLPLP